MSVCLIILQNCYTPVHLEGLTAKPNHTCCPKCRILAPSTYILFASAIPAIAFGEQFVRYTGRKGELAPLFVRALLKPCHLLI